MKTFTFEQQKVYPLRMKREQLLSNIKTPKKSWDDPEVEALAATNVPEEVDGYHTNFLSYLEAGYNKHQSIVLQPHVFWNMILNEISGYINENVEECRHLFTDSDEKKKIEVFCSSIIPPLNEFEKSLRELVPTNMDPFLPKFSTDTEQSKLANIATFMEAVSPYYSYSMFCCGYNAIRVDGTVEDWFLLVDTARHLTEVLPNLNNYLTRVSDTITSFVSWVQSGNGEQVAKILTNTRIGSGSDTSIQGWITKLYRNKSLPSGTRKACNFPTHVAKVPYRHNTFRRDFHLNYGLFSSKLDKDGFLVPDFSYIVNEKLK